MHPDAPDGGTGRGRARVPPSTTSSHAVSSAVPHPSSPAARLFDWGALPGLDMIERTADLKEALEIAHEAVWDAIKEETGEELREILEGIIPGLLLCLCAVAASSAIGGAAGAAIGALAAGVGAVPGAAYGAVLGFEAGMFVLTWLGVGFLVGTIGAHLIVSLKLAAEGVEEAWNAVGTPGMRELHVRHAGKTLARSVGVYMRGQLQAIVALILAGGAHAAASRAAMVVARMRQSRFGEAFAVWLERNWARLIESDRFRPPKDPGLEMGGGGGKPGSGAGAGAGAGKPAQPPKPEPKPQPKPPDKPKPKPDEPKPPDKPKPGEGRAKRIEPSRPPDPNATPRGNRTRIPEDATPENKRSLERENDSADILSREGYDVEQNPQVPPPKKPDYKIEGEVFDCYSPKDNTTPRNIASNVSDKVAEGQTERVVVNLQDWQGDVGALRQQMSDWPIQGLREMLVIDKSANVIPIVP